MNFGEFIKVPENSIENSVEKSSNKPMIQLKKVDTDVIFVTRLRKSVCSCYYIITAWKLRAREKRRIFRSCTRKNGTEAPSSSA